MDMKKKLDEAYLPEKEGRKKRVVVALSGGLNSFVTAYLLKIQKYDLIGVTIALNWENYPQEGSEVLSCHLNNPQVESIKEFCHQLGIPHFVVKASDEFKDEVVESWVTSRMTGTKANSCWNCHDLRMRLLHKKMIELEAHGLATGHLAKVFKQENAHSVYVHTSNDEQNDQSSLLSRLPHDVLDKLMLPLSDLQQKEINKLAENFGLNTTPKKLKMHECFNIEHIEEDYLDKQIPKKYRNTGELVGIDKIPIGDHKGILFHKFASVAEVPGQKQNEIYKIAKYFFSERRILVAKPEYFQRSKIFLNNCIISESTPWLEPMKGVVRLSETDFVDCMIYPKNLSSAIIILETPAEIQEGEILTILRKKGKNSKVYLTGKARYIVEEKTIMEEGKERVKVDYSLDF